jgi:NAD(P)H dehydrogenase (quinone)
LTSSIPGKTVLIAGATGDTGRAAVRESIALGLRVRAMLHNKDVRAEALEKLGAQVVIGDLLEINTIRATMEGVDAAYFVWPAQPGLIHATVNFAQAAKEADFKTVINLSQRSANRGSTTSSTESKPRRTQMRGGPDSIFHERSRAGLR